MDDESVVLEQFGAIIPDPPEMRDTCDRCRRPMTVCWCPFLPNPPIVIFSKVIILQHPFEESRCLRTAPMLKYGIAGENCQILIGKRFSPNKIRELGLAVADPNTLLMYPGPDATNLDTFIQSSNLQTSCVRFTVILLDGTWMQARGMYNQNKFLHSLKQIQLNTQRASEYVIRTQPTEGALSTLETAAITVSLLEDRPGIIEPLVNPLKALCDFQIQHGAVHHHSKQYLIENGLCERPVARSYKNKIMKMGATPVQDGNHGNPDIH